MVTKKTPGLRRADIFAREKREGWDSWGDEVGKFASAPSYVENSDTVARTSEPVEAWS